MGSWVEQLGLDRADYGTHTLRRTKATLMYRRTKNLRAVQLLIGHTKLESTVRYLGIEVNDSAAQEALEYPVVPRGTSRRFRLMDALKAIFNRQQPSSGMGGSHPAKVRKREGEGAR